MKEMQLGLELERELFLLSVVLGCGLGLLYDIFRVFRVALPHGKILTFFEDIIYTFLYGFALFTKQSLKPSVLLVINLTTGENVLANSFLMIEKRLLITDITAFPTVRCSIAEPVSIPTKTNPLIAPVSPVQNVKSAKP